MGPPCRASKGAACREEQDAGCQEHGITGNQVVWLVQSRGARSLLARLQTRGEHDIVELEIKTVFPEDLTKVKGKKYILL